MNSNAVYHIPFLANNAYIYGEAYKPPCVLKPEEPETLIASIRHPILCSKDFENDSPEFTSSGLPNANWRSPIESTYEKRGLSEKFSENPQWSTQVKKNEKFTENPQWAKQGKNEEKWTEKHRERLHPEETRKSYKDEIESNSYEASVLSDNKYNYLSRVSEQQDSFYKSVKDYRPLENYEENQENHIYPYRKLQAHVEKISKPYEEFSRYSQIADKGLTNSRIFLDNSEKHIKPKRDIWLQQAKNVKGKITEKPMLDMSRLEKSARSTSNNSRASKKSIKAKTISKPRSSSTKEKSFSDKEQFVTTMMKVIKNHSKYCSSLRREISAIKGKSLYEL